MRFKTNRANNGLYVGMSTTATQYGDTVHAGTPRDGIAGGCYEGDTSAYVNCGRVQSLEINNFAIEFYLFLPSGTLPNSPVVVSNGEHNIGGFLLSGWLVRFLTSSNTLNFTFYDSDTGGNNNTGINSDVSFTQRDEWVKVQISISTFAPSVGRTATVRWYVNDVLTETDTTSFTRNFGFVSSANNLLYLMGRNRPNIQTPLSDGAMVFGIDHYEINPQTLERTTNNNRVFYKCDEINGATAYDSSGNGRHGTITNATTAPGPTSIHQTQDIFSWPNVVGYTVSDGVTYFANNDGTGLIPVGVLIPRDESQQLPLFKCVAFLANGTQADLQFIGHAQYNADWVDSGAFQGNDSAHIDCGLITNGDLQNLRFSMSFERQAATQTDMLIHWNGRTPSAGLIIYINSGGSLSISIYTGTETPMFSNIPVNGVGEVNDLVLDYTENGLTLNINGNIHTASYQAIQYATTNRKTLIGAIQSTNITTPTNNKIWNVKVDELNASGDFVQMLADWPLVEPIENAANHTYYNRLGSNHATLTNGSAANYGRQDVFHPLVSEGFSNRPRFLGSGGIARNNGVDFSTRNWECQYEFIWDATNLTIDQIVGNRVTTASTGFHFAQAVDSDSMRVFAGLGGTFTTLLTVNNLQAGDIIRGVISQNGDTLSSQVFRNGVSVGSDTRTYTGNIVDGGGNNRMSICDNEDLLTGGRATMIRCMFTRSGTVLYDTYFARNTENEGWLDDNILSLTESVFIPKHATNNTDALGNPLTHPQDGETFLDCGTGFVMPRVPELVQADAQLVFYSTDSAPQNRSWDFIRLNQFNNNKVFVGNVNSDDGELSPIVFHENPLVRAQLDTEKRVRNAVDVGDIPLSVTLTAVRNSVSVVMYTITGTLLIAATEEIRFRTTITNANGAGNPSMVTTTINNGDTSGTNSVLTTISGTPATTGASFDVTVSAILVSPTIGYAITVETMTVTVPAFIDTSVFVTVGAMRMSNGNVRITYDGALDYAPREQVNVTITASNANGSGSINTTGVTFQADDTTAMNTIDIVNAITGAYTITFAVASVTTGFTAQLSTTSINIPTLSLSPVRVMPSVSRTNDITVTYTLMAEVDSALSTSDITVDILIDNINGSGSSQTEQITIPQNQLSVTRTVPVTAISGAFTATLMVTATTPNTHQGELSLTSLSVPGFGIPIRIEASAQRTSATSVIYSVRGTISTPISQAGQATIQLQNSNGIGGQDNIELMFGPSNLQQTVDRTVSLAGSLIGLNNSPFTVTVRQHPNFPPTLGFSLNIIDDIIMVPSF